MLGAVASFSTMAVAGREVLKELDVYQLMFYRSAIGLVLIVAFGMLSRGGFRQFRTRRLKIHLCATWSIWWVSSVGSSLWV